jgi:hypothetical protein
VNAGPGCYWARLSDFTGSLGGIIDNDFVSGGGQSLVTISASDAGFQTDADCGTWVPVSALVISDREKNPKDSEDLHLTWSADQQQQSGREPKPLIKTM